MNLPLFQENTDGAHTLEGLRVRILACQNCPLHAGRRSPVAGDGDSRAKIMLIGEAPGEQEDLCGRAFIGPAGQLLTKILAAISLKREEVYLTNILKCRPPGNRAPSGLEINSCIPWLRRQIHLINPRLILCLGKVAANAFFENRASLSQLRGTVYRAGGAQVMVTYHPAALLRNPAWKRGCWEDVKAFRRLYDEMPRESR